MILLEARIPPPPRLLTDYEDHVRPRSRIVIVEMRHAVTGLPVQVELPTPWGLVGMWARAWRGAG